MNVKHMMYPWIAASLSLYATQSHAIVLCSIPPPGPQGVNIVADDNGNTVTPFNGNFGNTTPFNDAVRGLGGPDIIATADGDDCIDGGDGFDVLLGGNGADAIFGGGGGNSIAGGEGDDILIGGLGNDLIDGGPGNDFIFGGGGSDTIIQGNSDETSHSASESIAGVNMLFGGPGNDQIEVIIGTSNQLYGGPGDDLYIITSRDKETLKRSRQTTRIIDLEGSNSIFLTNMTAGQVSFQRLDGTIEIIDNVSGKTIVTSLMNGTSAYHFSDGSFNSEDISHLIQ